jgi:hypothetical protein
MKLLLMFLLGAVLGFLGRVAWPTSAIPEGEMERPSWSRVARYRLANATSGEAEKAVPQQPRQSLDPEVAALLRRAGLYPAADDNFNGPSWLYVRAPRSVLLQNAEFVELSIAASEGGVEQTYGSILRDLGLSPATTDRIRRTLAEMFQARTAIRILGEAEKPPLESGRILQLIDESDAAFRERLRQEVGVERFAQFEEAFDDQALASIGNTEMAAAYTYIAATGSPLSRSQREAIARAFVDSANLQLAPEGWVRVVSPPFAQADGNWRNQYSVSPREIIELPQGVLTEEQAVAFERWQLGWQVQIAFREALNQPSRRTAVASFRNPATR